MGTGTEFRGACRNFATGAQFKTLRNFSSAVRICVLIVPVGQLRIWAIWS